ncbi:hypothetical protein [Olleya sp. R77988]|uniref:hypothetical protein n=1 Tax=Olleya sp. R77988 TaxID=3093875 RepID=UPI0037CA40FE
MKKSIVVFALLLSSFYGFAQETDNDALAINKKHELRLGVVKLLAGPIFEGVYEYVPNSNTGYGAALLFNLSGDNSYPEDYSLTPFYRMYFQTKEDYGAKGFFVEGFTSFFGGTNDDYYDYLSSDGTSQFREGDNFFDISIGLALGKKWINSSGFVFEAKIGAGRNLLNGSEFDALIKGDLYVGYRF